MKAAFVTILFTDLVGSTTLFDRREDEVADAIRRDHFAALRGVIAEHDGREVKSTGDGFLAVFDGPARAVRCAQAIVEAVVALGLQVRAGVHTGEVEVRGEDIGGFAVHVGARIASVASAGEVLTSRTVKDLVAGSGISFASHGIHELKGVPGEWELYAPS